MRCSSALGSKSDTRLSLCKNLRSVKTLRSPTFGGLRPRLSIEATGLFSRCYSRFYLRSAGWALNANDAVSQCRALPGEPILLLAFGNASRSFIAPLLWARCGQNLPCHRHTSTTPNPLNLAQAYVHVKLCAECALKAKKWHKACPLGTTQSDVPSGQARMRLTGRR